jgi:sugar O-acyltransferase (sialic acid O-acetyltransferase NeuD family)
MGREILDIAARGPARWREIVFVVDGLTAEFVCGVPVCGPGALVWNDFLCLAVGSSEARKTLATRFAGHRFASIRATSAIVSRSVRIGQGEQICDYAVINNGCQIGDHFQCNTFAQVSHDCIIGDFVTFSPRVSCNGWVEIGDDVFVGAGAIIRNGSPGKRLRIGSGATIGMGAVVTKDVLSGVTVIGNPARPI